MIFFIILGAAFYNGFLAAGLVWGFWLGDAGRAVTVFFLVCVVIAGLYVAYYGYYEIRLFFFDGDLDDPLVGFAEDIQTWLVNRMPNTDNYPAYLIGGLVVLAAGAAWSWNRSRRRTVADG